jgi:hypothetical protein
MRLRRFMLMLSLLLLGLALAPQITQAQTQITDMTCPALVQQALEDVGRNCDALDRNNACYGYNRVDATFAEPQADDFFSTPADRTTLTMLQTIQTAPLDTARELWGIATMNVQANVPGTLPGQAVVFMLLGDVAVENAVSPDGAFTPASPVPVTVTVNANVRSGPGTNWNIVRSATPGTEAPADGLSSDQAWVRVLIDGSPGWISRDLVRASGDVGLDTLPVIDGRQKTPMQAFYFRTGVTGIECVESPPSVLVIQGPQNVRVEITANGADIAIGSTIAMTTVGGKLQLFVLSGSAIVNGVVIPAGFMIEAPLSEDGRSLAGPWTGSRPMTADELVQFLPLQNIPENLLHYPIVLPSLRDIAAILAAIARQGTTVIQEGQTPGDGSVTPGDGSVAPGDGSVAPPPGGGVNRIVLLPGQYTIVGGNCALVGGTTISEVAPDGSGFTWGRVRFTRADENIYYAGALLIVVLAPDRIRVGGSEPGACVMDWARTG